LKPSRAHLLISSFFLLLPFSSLQASKATDTVSKTAGSVTAQATEGFSHLAEGGKGKAAHVNVTYPEPALVHPEEWEGKPITEAFNRVHPVQK